jgi:hypothetical protein
VEEEEEYKEVVMATPVIFQTRKRTAEDIFAAISSQEEQPVRRSKHTRQDPNFLY